MIEFNQLRYFYEVVKAGSFTQASKKLRVSQPSISKMVKQLEESQNLRFLDRTKKGVILTPLGKLLFERAEKVFSEMESISSSLQDTLDHCEGELWLGASDNVCNYLLPPLIKEFRSQHFKGNIKIYSGVSQILLEKIKDFRMELGILYTPSKNKEFQSEKLCFVEFVRVVSPEIHKKKSLFQVVMEKQFISSDSLDYSKPYPVLKMLRSIGIRPDIKIEANSLETQMRLTIEGVGYSILPKPMVATELKRRTLIEVPFHKKIGTPLYLVKLRSRTLTRTAELFADFLKTKLGDSV